MTPRRRRRGPSQPRGELGRCSGWKLGDVFARFTSKAPEGFTIGESLHVLRDLVSRHRGELESVKLPKLAALAEKPKWLDGVGNLRNLSAHPSKSDRDKMRRVLDTFFEGKGAELGPVLAARDEVEKWRACAR